jgi:hypothetical protein
MNRSFLLENGEASYVDFESNRNNRYLTGEQAVKNRPVAPSHFLYYFNTPPNMSEADIARFFEDTGAKRPIKVKNFPPRKESHRKFEKRARSLSLVMLTLSLQMNDHVMEVIGRKV